jgi:four helix bundle protein
MIGDYKKLQVWEKSMELVSDIYLITKKFPPDEIYGLTSQMRRASVSIPANISEGKLRNSDLDFRRFVLIAFGSGGELETHLEIARRLGYLDEVMYKRIISNLSEVMKMLNSLIKKLEANG